MTAGRRYGRSDIRRDFRATAARSVDLAWARAEEQGLVPCELDGLDPVTLQTELEERVEADLLDLLTESVAEVSGRYLDPDCRYIRHPAHVCHNRDGEPLRRHQSCWLESRLQTLEQGTAGVVEEAEEVVQGA